MLPLPFRRALPFIIILRYYQLRRPLSLFCFAAEILYCQRLQLIRQAPTDTLSRVVIQKTGIRQDPLEFIIFSLALLLTEFTRRELLFRPKIHF